MNKFGVSAQTLVAAAFGAAIMGSAVAVPRLLAPEAGAQPIAIQAPPGAPLSFADLIEKVEPAVVSVNVVSTQEVSELGDMDQFFEQFRGMPGLDEFFEERRQQQQVPDQVLHSTRAGARMSRLPLDCMGETSPAFSIASSSRAARL